MLQSAVPDGRSTCIGVTVGLANGRGGSTNPPWTPHDSGGWILLSHFEHLTIELFINEDAQSTVARSTNAFDPIHDILTFHDFQKRPHARLEPLKRLPPSNPSDDDPSQPLSRILVIH